MSMEEEIARLRQRADLLERLKEEFPDLHEHHTRWRVVLVSKKVNEKPEKAYTKHSCGCCSDAVVQAWFYAEREGEHVYSEPPYVVVGEKNPACAWDDDALPQLWDADWRDKVRAHAGEVGVKLLKG